MRLELLRDFEAASVRTPAAGELLDLVQRTWDAVQSQMPAWAASAQLRRYASCCLWASRKLEYGFAAEALASFEAQLRRPLRVLDVGCGCSPFSHWVALRGHQVTAIDTSASDIAFLIDNDVNALYGSSVDFQVGRAERLAFADATFDVVTCLSVLEHVPAGNDRLGLHELARVLTQGGLLIVTLGVGPVRLEDEGSQPEPARVRGKSEPFSAEGVRRLLRFVDQVFRVEPCAAASEVTTLTRDQVDDFWRSTEQHDHRSGVGPSYLVAAAILERHGEYLAPDSDAIKTALLEGQAALEVSRTTAPEPPSDDTILATRLRVIEEQEQALEAYLACRRDEGAWQWIPPRLGVLWQHEPMPAFIPEHYQLVPRLPGCPPGLSIVTPTLNQGQFIERTLRSVLDQRYPGLEYIVQDGASSDDTLTILRRYDASLTHVGSARDSGIAQALNTGFKRATGEILAYLNSDDLLLPGSLHFVAAFFAAHPDVDAVYGQRMMIDSQDAEVGRWILPAHDDDVMPWCDYIPQETLFWRRRLWDKVGAAMDESFRFAVDWELLLRFRQAGAKFVRLPRFLGAFRVHPQQKTSAQMRDIGAREIARLQERHLGRPVADADVEQHTRAYLRRHVVYHKLYRLGVLRY